MDQLQEWCTANKLDLNVKKCAVMSFTHKAEVNRLEYQYQISNTVLQRVKSKLDLGVTIDDKLSFKEHVNVTTRKAYRMLGFIFRCGKFFKSRDSLIILYNSLVRSRLEYCASVWSPIYKDRVEIIERVQRKFARMFFYKFRITKMEHEERRRYLNLRSLASRRLQNDELILYKLIHNRMDSSLVHEISYDNRERFTRQSDRVFYTPLWSSNIVRNEPLHRMQENHDKYFSGIYLMNHSFQSFKNLVKARFDDKLSQ